MLKKFLKEAVTIITGKQTEELVDLLDAKKHVNEFILAKKLDLTINQTRNLLYKISDKGLVSSIRKKDKRKGWYTYFWKIETLKSLEFLKNDLLKKINQLENQVKSRETKRFYVCERCHIELAEENALIYDFTCNECGAILTLKDNKKLIKEMKKNLDKFRKDLDFIEEEIRKEKENIEKIKERARKKEEKAKKLARKKPVKRKTALKKPVKKTTKKKPTSKKKPVKKVVKKKPVKSKVATKKKKPAKKIAKKKKPVKKTTTKKKSKK